MYTGSYGTIENNAWIISIKSYKLIVVADNEIQAKTKGLKCLNKMYPHSELYFDDISAYKTLILFENS